MCSSCDWSFSISFSFNDTSTTEIYTLSLHDALPISGLGQASVQLGRIAGHGTPAGERRRADCRLLSHRIRQRSEEHTSELQSLRHLVCRLLLEKKKRK